MRQSNSGYFLNTHAILIINELKTLRAIIHKRTKLIKDTVAETAEDNTERALLNQQQLNDILHGPYAGFIKLILSGYASVIHVQQQKIRQDEGPLKQSASEPSNLPTLNKNLLNNISHAELEKMISQLNMIAIELEQEWAEHAIQWGNNVTEGFTREKTGLNHSETEELLLAYPLSELIDRFTDIDIKIPDLKKQEHYTFSTFYQLKAKLAAYNYLGREQQICTEEAIKYTVKPLKDIFNRIAREEKNLLDNTEKEINIIIKKIKV